MFALNSSIRALIRVFAKLSGFRQGVQEIRCQVGVKGLLNKTGAFSNIFKMYLENIKDILAA